MDLKGCIFDLDGVIVDTAKYHYLAWKRLADELGILFTEEDNEALKGVSRMASLDILLSLGKVEKSHAEKDILATTKNSWYVEYISTMTPEEILPGSQALLRSLKEEGISIALGSASKNAAMILDRIGLRPFFDTIVDGHAVTKAKPDPEVFLKCASSLGLDPAVCVVFEDAIAGVQAAHAGGMRCVGVGKSSVLGEADLIVPGLNSITIEQLRKL